MDFRRLTVFPRTGYGLDHANRANDKDSAPLPNDAKRKFHGGGNGPLGLRLPEISATLHATRKIFTPVDGDPELCYQCIHSVDPEGKRPYCLAQQNASDLDTDAYRVVMIRRSSEKLVVGLEKPNPNILNILSVFRFQASLFTVFERPGLPLSEIAVSHSPQIGLAEVKTISAEAISGICALSAAGFDCSSIQVEDITISASDGQIKVAYDRSTPLESMENNASAFGIMLEDLMSRVPSPWVLQQSDGLLTFIQNAGQMTYQELRKDVFLEGCFPAPSLIPLVLNAQIIVIPVEHVADTRITELRIGED